MFMQNVIPNLLTWYQQNHRKLPWRESVTPYQIWVSEIILQQTRVDQGGGYFFKFVDKFPDIFSLAAANESEILKIWQGLGYYARARNMHFAAKQIVYDYHGKFPESYLELKKLKGVGDYTAAAIASFAFKLAHPAIDGNVKRVSARFFGIDTPINSPSFYNQALNLLSDAIQYCPPDIFNQAMIEMGAMVCTPQNPRCGQCPLKEECVAFKFNKVSELPVTVPKKSPLKKYLHYFLVEQGGNVAIMLRPSSGIWGGLHEFPNTEHSNLEHLPLHFLEELGLNSENIHVKKYHDYKHLLTHLTIFARCWHLSSIQNNIVLSKQLILVNSTEIRNFPMHKLMLKMLNNLNL